MGRFLLQSSTLTTCTILPSFSTRALWFCLRCVFLVWPTISYFPVRIILASSGDNFPGIQTTEFRPNWGKIGLNTLTLLIATHIRGQVPLCDSCVTWPCGWPLLRNLFFLRASNNY